MDNVFVGRQPIYDSRMQVFAYEILYRSGATGGANFVDGNLATSQVLINTFLEIGLERLTDNHPAFFNLTREFLLNKELSLPKELVFLEVLENIDVDQELVDAVRALSKMGYRIALDDFAFEDRWLPLLEIADVIKVEVPAMKPEDIREKIRKLRPYKAKLLAEKVETHEEYDQLKKMGFHYFQGYFFCKPRIIEAKRVSTSQLAVLSLLAQLQKPDVNVNELEKIISSDPTLSFKLLKYLNSPHLALRNRIQSIRQAITYLGIRPLRSWVSLLAMTGVKDKPSELSRTAMQRARKCEQVCKIYLSNPESDSYFMAGLLSVLDALMDMPMEEILKQMPLSEEVQAGLLNRQGKVGQVLDAVIQAEMGNPTLAESLPRPKDVPSATSLFLEAMFWADEQMKAIGVS
ncbi:MAG: HDOD domain-containing protein [Magnetococcales bacterium]|nr:HDOD domain-containing protein [Magnetococcales bacterium]NGZ27150.1 HDOD domain-containing protein [Magnetococcales bacterium]